MKYMKKQYFGVQLSVCYLAVMLLSLEYIDTSILYYINLILIIPILVFLNTSLSRVQNLQKEVLERLNNYANSLDGTGDQIFDSCWQINTATDEQVSAILETSSAADQISAMAQRSLSNVSEAEISIEKINNIIQQSAQSSSMLSQSYTELNEQNIQMENLLLGSVKMLEELGELFNEVTTKTGVINDIVFQTKLLSFNASVEAARAGEHGKGFSVVAEEIGNLANMSGESASSIQDILEKTQEKVNIIKEEITLKSKKAIENMNAKILEGGNIVMKFQTDFSIAKGSSKEVLDQITQVSSASDEQTKGIQELRRGIHLVNEAVQRNSLVVSQTTDLAKVLNSEMLGLQGDINTFKKDSKISFSEHIEVIAWSSKYELGIELIDGEHIILLDRINELINAMNTDRGISEAFAELITYTKKHFSDEEKYMESIQYPSLESHKKVHINLISTLNRFGDELRQGQLQKNKIASFLKNWLFTHIMGIDLKYSEFENSK